MSRKTCVDCHHSHRETFQTPQGFINGYLCNNPDLSDPVNGEPLACQVVRSNSEFCGINGKHWKKREEAAIISESPPNNVIQLAKA